jgi:uncharacterized protein (TIRG00374 family)
VSFDGVTAVAKRLQWSWVALALIALAAGYAARVYRWWWMLRICNPAVTLRSCTWPLIVGFAVNNVVPFRAGDALRVVGFRRQLDTSVVRVLGSLLIERILDLTILVAFLLIGIFGLRSSEIPAMYLRTAALVAGAGVLGWTVLLWMGDSLEALFLKICRSRVLAARGLSSTAEQHVRNFFVALNVARTPERALKLLAMSAVVWCCEGGVFACVAKGLHYDGRAFGPWFALATGSLSTLIPSSPGYVGTFDFFALAGLVAYGASNSAAAAITFIVHGVLWLPLTVAGLAYLLLVYLRDQGRHFTTRPTQRQERT